MEILFEVVMEIILEGAFEVASSESRKVPVPLRVLCTLLVAVIFGGVFFLIVFVGINSLYNGDVLLAVVLFAVAAFFLGASVLRVVKFSHKRK